MTDSPFFFAANLVIYILASRLVMRSLVGASREAILALLNVAGLFLLHIGSKDYLLLVAAFYLALWLFAEQRGIRPWVAFFAPIAALIALRYVPASAWAKLVHVIYKNWLGLPSMVGISYLSFRCSRLVLEVRNGAVKKPNFLEYVNFAFFLPTMSVGPINTYANFRRGFEVPPWEAPVGRASLRVLVGLVKYQFLGGIFNQLTYGRGFLLNGRPHHWIDLPIAMVFYYLYLYCNFSGFCDMAIGAAALIGIPVLENFDNPFAARNMKEFWNRWHITLSQWMRDIVFAPLSKFLVRVMGPARVNHAIALAIFVVFLLIGIWHGVGWNYAVFGLLQAIGVVANHYYTIGLKKWLGRDGFKAYNENRCIHSLAVVSTFCYYAATLLFFANSLPQIKAIFSMLR
jgi:D-alanyl-lipoteichoic acid acyltransferase DltB (MBOAT superfamily)